MKTMLITLCILTAFGQRTATLKPNDLDGLTGKKWTGTLTYLDYLINKLEVIPTEVTVRKSDKGPGIYKLATVYPQETSHNSTDELVISRDGKQLDDESVKERALMNDGTLKITTTKAGQDNNKKATFRITYLIGKTSYSRKKEVCYEGSTAWFTRNELNLKIN